MITHETLTDDPAQVTRIIHWWISQSKTRYRMVRCRGTVSDFVNDVWCRLLAGIRRPINYSLVTVITNSCKWELYNHKTNRDWDLNCKLRHARGVAPDDRITHATDAQDHVDWIELNAAISWVLRTLTYREAIIIRARLGLLGDPTRTLEEIGKVLNITRERVRQISLKGFWKICDEKRKKHLRPFMDLDAIRAYESRLRKAAIARRNDIEQRKLDNERLKRLRVSESWEILCDELIKD